MNIAERPKFLPHSPFRRELAREVQVTLANSGSGPKGGWRIAVKSAVILCWAVLSYMTAVFWAHGWLLELLALAALALAIAAIGFNIQHDGGHRSFSSNKLANRLAALALDAVGGSSYVWHHKHNILHHTFPNVGGLDNDLEAGPFVRLGPHKRRRRYHRFQHIYAWALYGALAIKWQLFDDYVQIARGRIGDHRIPRPRRSQLAQFIAGKVFFLGWAFVLPLILHRALFVIPAYVMCSTMVGVILAVVFQLAHCVDDTVVTQAPAAGEGLPLSWAEHQVATTVNFANRNKLVTWYVGGLNYQIEHHLFPRISHVNYPLIAPVVRAVCERHGVAYHSTPSFRAALASHARFLKRWGASSPPSLGSDALPTV